MKTMKKMIIVLLAMVLLFGICLEANAAMKTTKFFIGQSYYEVNGQRSEMDAAPYVDENGRTLVPLRYVAAAVGVPNEGIAWNQETQQATLQRDDRKMVIPVGKNYYIYSDSKHEVMLPMDTMAVLNEGRIMLPAKYVATSFSASAAWNGEKQSVVISWNAPDIETPQVTAECKFYTELMGQPVVMGEWTISDSLYMSVLVKEDVTLIRLHPTVGISTDAINNLADRLAPSPKRADMAQALTDACTAIKNNAYNNNADVYTLESETGYSVYAITSDNKDGIGEVLIIANRP